MCLTRPTLLVAASSAFETMKGAGPQRGLSTETRATSAVCMVQTVEQRPRFVNSWRTMAWNKETAGVELSDTVGLEEAA